PAGENQVHRLGFTDRASEALRTAHAGNHAEPDFGLAEFCCVGGDDEIGHHRQLAPAAEREAVHRRDPWLASAADDVAGPARERVVAVEVRGWLVGHFLDIGARREGLLARSRQNRTTLGLVGFERPEYRDQILQNRIAQRVESFRTIERDEGDRPARFNQKVGVTAHTTPKASIASATFLNPAMFAPLT